MQNKYPPTPGVYKTQTPITVYKKIQYFESTGVCKTTIAVLEIPIGATIVVSLLQQDRIRFSEAMVVFISSYRKDVRYYSLYDPEFEYVLGETVIPDELDQQIAHLCTNGIHAFMNYDDAESYTY